MIPMTPSSFRRRHRDLYCDKGPIGWSCSRYPTHEGPCALHARFWNVHNWSRFRLEAR